MPAWDIQPGGVRTVLSRTSSTAAAFEGQLSRTQQALAGGAEQSGSGLVADALGGFVTAVSGDITAVLTRTGNCLTGAAEATTAYVRGDLEMAANAQRSAAAAPAPEMPGQGGRAGR